MLVPNVSAGLPQLDVNRLEQLKELERRLEFKFRDFRLYDLALTHSSFANELGSHRYNNQRLEYFGDAIIGFIVNEHLFLDYHLTEGQMARIKSAAVSEKALASAARAVRLGSYLRMSKGERKSGGSRRPSNLADAFEAVVAAIYVDRGMKQVRSFVVGLLDSRLKNLSQGGRALDPKSALQELVQKRFRAHPTYELISQEGPDHKREFVYGVVIDGKEIARGIGSSRKRAERQAAVRALELLRNS